jgi:hypothetical protein
MMWFHCRDMPSDTPRLIMRRAKALLAKDLAALYPLYLQAILRHLTVRAALPLPQPPALQQQQQEQQGEEPEPERVPQTEGADGEDKDEGQDAENDKDKSTPEAQEAQALEELQQQQQLAEEEQCQAEQERRLIAALQEKAPLAVADVQGLPEGLGRWDFAIGLVGLNRVASNVSQLPDEERRKLLFGADQLVA